MTSPSEDELLGLLREEWLGIGQCTEPADRTTAEWAVRFAIESTGRQTHSMLFVWAQSPMAGVLASTYLGFALSEPMKTPMMKPLNAIVADGAPNVTSLRRDVDETVWRARTAVHEQIAAELESRGPAWDQWRREVGNDTWNRVWQTIGDPMYSQGWEQQSLASEGLFEENLTSWADAMMEGQFGAGTMAELDALHALNGVDVTPFDGIRRLARNCGWWWAYEVGAVLCERPARFEVSGEHVMLEFRDGWIVRT